MTVETLPLAELRGRAVAAWEDRNADSAAGADEATIQRWPVNYARHHLTRYDHAIEALAGRTGCQDAVTALRRRVYGAIAATYPSLAGECRRQAYARNASANCDIPPHP